MMINQSILENMPNEYLLCYCENLEGFIRKLAKIINEETSPELLQAHKERFNEAMAILELCLLEVELRSPLFYQE